MVKAVKDSSQLLRHDGRSIARPPPLTRGLAFGRTQLLHSSRVSIFDPRLPTLPLQIKHTAVYMPPKRPDPREQRISQGRTLDELRSYFPTILREEIPDETLSDDVVFLDAIGPKFGFKSFDAYGKQEYQATMWYIRFYVYLLCKQTKVEILKFWQPSKESVIVRWTMKFRPRLLHNFYGTTLQLDGISEMKLDSDGRIYQHRVDITDRHGLKFDLNFQPFALRMPPKTPSPIS